MNRTNDKGERAPRLEPGSAQASVIVIGAGVSGCACAAALAARGLRVTLMNSAMDRVGLPAYGPDVIAGEGDWRQLDEVMLSLPEPLRNVWLQAAMRPQGGGPVLNIDRRRVSIETKRVLERIPGLEFRQGFVTDLRLVNGSSEPGEVCDGGQPTEPPDAAVGAEAAPQAEIETIFGEVFRADAVVVAAGLSLGGHSIAGSGAVPGGRYGEPASDGLFAALVALGAAFRDSTLLVGARISADNLDASGWSRGLGDEGEALTERTEETALFPALSEDSPVWPEDYPPAPHCLAELRGDRMVLFSAFPDRGARARRPVISPDGAATAEVYLSPRSLFERQAIEPPAGGRAPAVSRIPLEVTGKVVVGLSDTGRMTGAPGRDPIWVVGRAAGAKDYLESLASAVRAASDIGELLGVALTPPVATARESSRGGRAVVSK